MLSCFNIGELRALLLVIQFFLIIAVMIEFGKLDIRYVWLFGVIVLFINPITTALTFEESDIFVISLAATLFILRWDRFLKQNNRYLFFFLLLGIIVSYVDFLTYPVVAYGIPLIVMLAVNNYSARNGTEKVIFSTIMFGSGYAGMWSGKWVIASLITKRNIIKEAVSQLIYRTYGDIRLEIGGEDGTSFINAIKHLWYKMRNPIFLTLMLVAIAIIFIFMLRRKNLRPDKNMLCDSLPIMLVGVSPFIWTAIAANHTIIHPHMAYRNMAVFFWALFTIYIRIFPISNARRMT